MSRAFKMAPQVNSLAMHLTPDGLSSRCGTPGKRRKLPPRSYPLTVTHELWYAGILAHTQR